MGVLAPPNGVPPIGVIEPVVPTSREWGSLFGVEKRPVTGGPPAGFSDDGVLRFAALGVKKPPAGFGVAAVGAGDEAANERFIFVGDIIMPLP